MKYILPDLPYGYDALEPHIDEMTMKIHHDKHHFAYVGKLNAAVEKHNDYFEGKTIEEVLTNIKDVPTDIQAAVRNNGGGHANHSIYWSVMGVNKPIDNLEIEKAIKEEFGSVDTMKEEFLNAAATQFGSGWAWLVVSNGKLKVCATSNQDTPLSNGDIPILALDVWEHAYYLKYQNLRPDYTKAFWNVINWEEVNRRYQEATK
ncbi:MAG: superoxide dismutase [Anaerorhabdus sp.]